MCYINLFISKAREGLGVNSSGARITHEETVPLGPPARETVRPEEVKPTVNPDVFGSICNLLVGTRPPAPHWPYNF